ncbi:hypothetical protein E8Q33_11695 [Methylophaga sp. SB9B]|uniref:hypothetical protein n=1 Tax=Methylophaga sp. SB9B TaxID=2570356 RepID=UPI0010A94C68|nr:hypothetical protein [Methylophaga sp. SB9B]THK40724.1 hypothetical protein E8Q33_11695 [Methylophaga sp. SB9B]
MLNTAACQKDVTILVVDNNAAKSPQAYIPDQVSHSEIRYVYIQISSEISEDNTFFFTLKPSSFTPVPNQG